MPHRLNTLQYTTAIPLHVILNAHTKYVPVFLLRYCLLFHNTGYKSHIRRNKKILYINSIIICISRYFFRHYNWNFIFIIMLRVCEACKVWAERRCAKRTVYSGLELTRGCAARPAAAARPPINGHQIWYLVVLNVTCHTYHNINH